MSKYERVRNERRVNSRGTLKNSKPDLRNMRFRMTDVFGLVWERAVCYARDDLVDDTRKEGRF